MNNGRSRRRALLRMAALASGVGALTPGALAGAASGDPVRLGRLSDAGEGLTTLKSTGRYTLKIVNRDPTTDPHSQAPHAALVLSSPGDALAATGHIDVDAIEVGSGISVRSVAYGLYADALRGPAVIAVSHNKEPSLQAVNAGAKGVALTTLAQNGKWHLPSLGVFGLIQTDAVRTVVVPSGESEVTIDMGNVSIDGRQTVVLATIQGPSTVGVLWVQVLNNQRVKIRLTGPAPADLRVGLLAIANNE